MGACQTTEVKINDSKKSSSETENKAVPYVAYINPRNSRINLDASESMKRLKVNGKRYDYDISYCYVSQKGFYPNQFFKANQDSYVVYEDILADTSCHLFGVFDGHGDVGDFCSHFCAEQFGPALVKELHAAGGTQALDTAQVNKLYTNTFVKVNRALHKSDIDDSLSGTTGITILVKGDKLFVGNVGDSRAIIATNVDGKLKYSALSSDQTPFRKDERERLKLKGARIFTIDQIDGHEPIHENWGNGETGDEIDEASGDPPRVWDKTLEKPGCAFTRSLGDAVAETIGVFAEPEILTWELKPSDKFAIVASDGVFEFLPNQAVVDIVARYTDAIEAGRAVCAEAYRLWLENDERTDDITIIIINFEQMRNRDGTSPSSEGDVSRSGQQMPVEQSRPVRNVMSKARRKDISENFADADDVEYDFQAHISPKTPEELARVSAMVKSNFMFQHLSAQQREQIFSVMTLKAVEEGELIIREGDPGDVMYIIDEGEFSVLKKNAEGVSTLVFTYTSIGAAFGELSLMYGKPRAASIKAKTKGKLWVLGRQAFRAVVMKKNPVGTLSFLKCVPIFRAMEVPKLHRLCQRCLIEDFKDGEIISAHTSSATDEGAEAIVAPDTKGGDWYLALVMSGSAVVEAVESSNPKSPRSHNREEGSYFVKMEMGKTIKKIRSEGRTKIIFISTKDFLDLVGPAAEQDLQTLIETPKHRGKPLKRKLSFDKDAKLIDCPRSTLPRDNYKCEMKTLMLGDYAYIGAFNSKNFDPTCSAKVIFKKRALDARMDTRLLFERQVLSTLAKTCNNPCIAKVTTVFQNDKVILMFYSDLFVCDLGLAIHQNVIDEEAKTYYASCLFSAVFALHDQGVMHRFINPGTIYITSKGIPKITDLRYAKKMDGQKAYTVCGDPLYFAPELVKQQGYDFGVDLWALGCVLYEMYEGASPMGAADIEETQLFKKIMAFDPDKLEFTKLSHKKVRSVITALLEPECLRRCGYRTQDDLKSKKLFMKVDWKTVGDGSTEYLFELVSHIDENLVLPLEETLEDCKTDSFDAF